MVQLNLVVDPKHCLKAVSLCELYSVVYNYSVMLTILLGVKFVLIKEILLNSVGTKSYTFSVGASPSILAPMPLNILLVACGLPVCQ